MAISIDWATKIINVPKADTTLVDAGPPEIRELDVDVFRKALNALQAGEEGIWADTTHLHNTTVTVGGVILARVVEIINGYTVTFEAGAYAVNLVGANNNISDVMNLNSVSLRSANSAGLQIVETGVSGLTAAESTKLTNIDTRATATDRAIRNKYIINRVTGMIDIYTDDGLSLLVSVPIYEDQDAATPVGSTITRIDRREKIDL